MIEQTTMSISDARKRFTQLDDQLDSTPVIWVERHGKISFALVSVAAWDQFEIIMYILKTPGALEMLRKSLEDIKAGRVKPHDQVTN